jgi:hypothetical protein
VLVVPYVSGCTSTWNRLVVDRLMFGTMNAVFVAAANANNVGTSVASVPDSK